MLHRLAEIRCAYDAGWGSSMSKQQQLWLVPVSTLVSSWSVRDFARPCCAARLGFPPPLPVQCHKKHSSRCLSLPCNPMERHTHVCIAPHQSSASQAHKSSSITSQSRLPVLSVSRSYLCNLVLHGARSEILPVLLDKQLHVPLQTLLSWCAPQAR